MPDKEKRCFFGKIKILHVPEYVQQNEKKIKRILLRSIFLDFCQRLTACYYDGIAQED